MLFVLFFHVVCKISFFNVWTAKYLAKASCTELTLITWKMSHQKSLKLHLRIDYLPYITWKTTSCLIWIVESLYTYAKICSFLTVADFNKFQHIIVQCTLNDATFDMNLIGPLWMGVSLIFIHIRCLLLCRCFMFYEIPGKNLMSSFHPPTDLTYFSY